MQSTLNWYVLRPHYLTLSLHARQFAEFKRLERDHAKEKQKLFKDKDAGLLIPRALRLYSILRPIPAKSQLTKANQTKTKMENLARELQKVRFRRSLSSAIANVFSG